MTQRLEPSLTDDAPDALASGASALPEAAAPTGSGDDPLLQSVVYLTRHHQRERSAASLVAGFPMDGALGPDQAVRMLRESGFNAGLLQRRIGDIHALLLPAVLLLKDGDACIVVQRGSGGSYDVVMPGPEFHSCQASEAELEAEYSGVALVATPQTQARPESHAAAQEAADASGHWFWSTMRRFVPYYRSALLAALLSNVLMLASGLVMSVAYDKVIPHQSFVTLWSLATGAVIALAFDLMARQLRAHLIDLAGRKTDLIVGSVLFRHTLALRMEHRPASAGSHAHHLGQIEVVREFFASATLSALSDLPFIFIFVAMIFSTGGELGWVLVVAIPLIIGLALGIQRSLRRSMRANMAHHADLQGTLVEAVEGLEDLKAAGAQGRFLHRYEGATAAAAESALRSRSLAAWTNNLSSGAQQLVTLVMLVWGVYLIHDGVLTQGALIGAIMYAGRAVQPLTSVVGLATRYQGARAAMQALDQVMKLPVERDAGTSYVAHHQLSGRVGLHEVAFSYPHPEPGATEAAPLVLKGINLAFEPGERVAILGRIGSGKSTILRMLAGLYQPTEGRVEVDGLDLRQIDPADFRAQVGFVSQEPRLFNGTLRDNVMMGRPGIDPAQLMAVAKLTGLDRMVAGHSKGWELAVGEMGGMLSGGQRQLVALARCLVTQPQILLMDEPTSSMDAQSELLFLRQLKEAAGTRTLVMVTHRPAVLDLVTRIVVIDGGKVVMDGPKMAVLAALSGAKPAAPAAASMATSVATSEPPNNLHMHPATQPVQRAASV